MEPQNTQIDAQIFEFSPAMLKKKRLTILTLQLMVPTLFILFFLLSEDSDLSRVSEEIRLVAPMFLLITIVFELLLWFQGRSMISKLRDMSVRVMSDSFEKVGGDSKELFMFAEVTHVVIMKLNHGAPIAIRVTCGKRGTVLAGFENMETLAQVFKSKAGEKCEIKNTRVDWNEPQYVLACILFVTIALLVVNSFGPKVQSYLPDVANLAVGVWLLISKPVTKSMGLRLKTTERVVAILLLVIALVSVSLKFIRP